MMWCEVGLCSEFMEALSIHIIHLLCSCCDLM
jgi:hypothetical protein